VCASGCALLHLIQLHMLVTCIIVKLRSIKESDENQLGISVVHFGLYYVAVTCLRVPPLMLELMYQSFRCDGSI